MVTPFKGVSHGELDAWWCDEEVQRAGGIWGKSHCDPKRSIWAKTTNGVSQEGRLAQKTTSLGQQQWSQADDDGWKTHQENQTH